MRTIRIKCDTKQSGAVPHHYQEKPKKNLCNLTQTQTKMAQNWNKFFFVEDRLYSEIEHWSSGCKHIIRTYGRSDQIQSSKTNLSQAITPLIIYSRKYD